MGWKDVIKEPPREIAFPWIGGRQLQHEGSQWHITGKLPEEHGWFTFLCRPDRTARLRDVAPPNEIALQGPFKGPIKGYLVGDRIIPDSVSPRDVNILGNISETIQAFDPVHLLPPNLDRFARISAGHFNIRGPLFFISQEFPYGAEAEVYETYLRRFPAVAHVKGVTPALDAAFRLECHHRDETERRRAELEKQLRDEAERRALEEKREAISRQLGDAAGRRELAAFDFATAAKAALAIGGAEYLDHRKSHHKQEMAVTFRLEGRRFECTCHASTLRIIDSGICLTAHNRDDGFDVGTKGDDFFTLESLPAVILESMHAHRLVVYRHVDDDPEDDNENDDQD